MTTVGAHERHEERAGRLARLARRVDPPADAERDAAGRDRLMLAVAKHEAPGRRRVAPWVAAALVAAVGAAVVLARAPSRLEYRVMGPVMADGAWLGVAPSGGPLSLRFSDGTELDLGPGSKGKVAEVTTDGARVVLGAGVLQARVVHRPHARWAVTAGPYTIEVTGTAFDVGWSETSAELDLSLHDGCVVVRGPSMPDGLRVAAGQRLVARASTGEARVSSLLSPQPPPESPAAPPALSSVAPAPAHAASRAQPSWSDLLADGNFRSVLDAAEARGVEVTLSRSSLADVVAFADAARYAHEHALAKRGLLAERSRFPGSPEARGAAFVLGRMADEEGARDEAVRWYDAYLAESPHGSLQEEALGRKLVALVESGDAAGARPVAQDYLRRFPQGPHASYAHDHASAP